MSAVMSTLRSPVTLTTDDIVMRAINGSLPTFIKVVDSAAPISAETAGHIRQATEFIPNAGTHGAGGNLVNKAGEASVKTSPTLSAATIATPITWADECNMERILGRGFTNKLIKQFDPTASLPRGVLRTDKVATPRDRYTVHELIERVWQSRLLSKTAKDNTMFIWVHGSTLPKALQDTLKWHPLKQKVVKTGNNVTAPVVKPAAPASNMPRAQREYDAAWGGFAVKAHNDYTRLSTMSASELAKENLIDPAKPAMSDEEMKAAIKKYYEEAEAKTNLKATVAAEETTTVKKSFLPPHLRKKMANQKTEDVSVEWVAAKLPFPCSSE